MATTTTNPTTITPTPRFIVVERAARMPSSCWGRYVRIGVVEVEPGFEGEPKMLSDRARGVKRVVETWERLNVGKTERCAAARARREAEALADQLNSEVVEEVYDAEIALLMA